MIYDFIMKPFRINLRIGKDFLTKTQKDKR
jgi:hypothetical protein